MNSKNQDTIKRIIDVTNIIRQKYNNLKRGRTETAQELEKTFKPITQPLKKLLKLEKKHINSEQQTSVSPSIKPKKEEDVYTHPKKSFSFSTPKTFPGLSDKGESFMNDSFQQVEEENVQEEKEQEEEEKYDDDDDNDDNDDYESETNVNEEYYNLLSSKDNDNVYGVRKNLNGELIIGDTIINIDNNNISVKDKIYEATVGLYELLFKKRPKKIYTRNDIKSYTEIVLRTNAHKRGYDKHGQINGTSSKKYREIIKPAIKQEIKKRISSRNKSKSTEGFGLVSNQLTVNDKEYNYIFWDNPNELVSRLHLLLSSKEAGHTNLDNEILAVVEELREADITI